MATQVLIAHTGQRLQIDASQLPSYRTPSFPPSSALADVLPPLRVDDFKAAVARQTSIPTQCIITLTPQGKPLKLQAIQTEVGGPKPSVVLFTTLESDQASCRRKYAFMIIG